jgi:hypothetical protein
MAAIWSFDLGRRNSTDPVALRSTWEHQTVEKPLKALCPPISGMRRAPPGAAVGS